MRWWILVTLVATVGCKDRNPPSEVVEPPEESEVLVDDDTADTDFVIDTNAGWSDSFVETGAMLPGDSSPIAPPTPDSGLCPFGELPDCDGICFPTYFIGDGTCDDGWTFQSNFNCVDYNFDNGDCAQDTGIRFDTGVGCLFDVVLDTNNQADQIGWAVTDRAGRVIHEALPGSYVQDNRVYVHSLRLAPGDHVFRMTDSAGNGWQGATWTVRHPVSGEVFGTGTLTGGTTDSRSFTVDCDSTGIDTGSPAACGDVRVRIETKGFGGEVSWDIVDAGDDVLADGSSYLSNRVYRTRHALGEGRYHFRLYDAHGDGWSDSTFRVEDAVTGDLLTEGTMVWGSYSARPFAISCSPGFDPQLDDTDAPPFPVGLDITCSEVAAVITTGADGSEAGFELVDGTGTVLTQRLPGVFTANTTYWVDVPVEAGPHTLRLTDAGGDGWDGGRVGVFDVGSGAVFLEEDVGFTGTSTDVAFTATCGEVLQPPEDTAVPTDTAVCAPDAERDCTGICWPSSFIGDGFCDDGTLFAPNFDCPTKGFDGGDCQGSP
jgi:hypothetical protein